MLLLAKKSNCYRVETPWPPHGAFVPRVSACDMGICVPKEYMKVKECQYLWDVIIYPCPWYLFLAHKSSRVLIFHSRLPVNGRHYPDDINKCIFLNENVWISIKIPVKFVPKGPISNIPALFQIMAWRRPGDKPLSETMVVTLLTDICIARRQWVKWGACSFAV